MLPTADAVFVSTAGTPGSDPRIKAGGIVDFLDFEDRRREMAEWNLQTLHGYRRWRNANVKELRPKSGLK
ncbi:hypothetical protein FKP32DRAFT_1670956, partial [Trametes sanguinea]